MGIDDSKPISTLVAPSSNKKLVSKIPVVALLKIVAKTLSTVDARRLVRIAALEIVRGGLGTTTASDNAVFSKTSTIGTGLVSSRMQSTAFLTMLNDFCS